MKSKAFTILEVLTVVVLTSMLVGFSFVVYVNFNKTFIQFDRSTSALIYINTFKLGLENDWQKCETPIYANNHLVLDSVSYEFDEEYIIRKTVKEDTFNIKLIEVTPKFVLENDIYINNLKLLVELRNQKYKVDLHCFYTPKILLELEY